MSRTVGCLEDRRRVKGLTKVVCKLLTGRIRFGIQSLVSISSSVHWSVSETGVPVKIKKERVSLITENKGEEFYCVVYRYLRT